MERVIENPRTGERIVIRQNASDAPGDVLVFDLFLPPGGHVPAGHTHPHQHERFHIKAGRLSFRINGRTIVGVPGDIISIPPRTPHWFANRGDTAAELRVEVRPPLRMEELLEKSASIHRLAELALIPLQFQAEVGVPNIPAFIIRWLLTPLVWARPLLTR